MQHRIRTALDWIQWSRIPVSINLSGWSYRNDRSATANG